MDLVPTYAPTDVPVQTPRSPVGAETPTVILAHDYGIRRKPVYQNYAMPPSNEITPLPSGWYKKGRSFGFTESPLSAL